MMLRAGSQLAVTHGALVEIELQYSVAVAIVSESVRQDRGAFIPKRLLVHSGHEAPEARLLAVPLLQFEEVIDMGRQPGIIHDSPRQCLTFC